MSSKDVRWEQRFSNYRKALSKLSNVVESREFVTLSELEKDGIIHLAKNTYDLAWNTLQDLFRYQGYVDVAGPGPVIETAFRNNIISNAEGWKKLKKSRQLTSHTYNSETAEEIAEAIVHEYYFLFKDLESRLEKLKGK